ncbi:dephospho-CoA kinase [Leucobacter luti]|uniref:dephospho-CoA kinase n=1 Tax=Leucobacter luti TaxID=340320 RepID=UPI003D0276B4
MQLIVLTGGIASGKSTIGRRLETLGATRIDSDQLAREAVEPGSPGLAGVVARFGAGILLPDGTLDRAALGAIVFADPAALADLNGIVHPEIARLYEARLAAIRAADPDAIVVYEVPLLVEGGKTEGWDLILVAHAPAETRVARMVTLRGMDEGEARRRIANQASDEERLAVADEVIDTSGTEAETLEQVDQLWARLTT